uniref:ALMS motif domain-containing protein n=1 Tax=Scophthalmus maximus TaxID=52904 RepID=A0A8D3BDS9_SCOMX
MRVSKPQPDVGKQKPTIVTPNEVRPSFSPADGFLVRDPARRNAQVVQHRLSYTEGDLKRDVLGGSLMNLSSLPSYRSYIHREVPLRSTSSVVFLDKSLSISLVELEGRGAGQPALYRSTLSVRIGVASCCRSSTDTRPAKTKRVYGRPRASMLDSNKPNGQDRGLGHCISPLSKQQGHKVELTAHANGYTNKADDSDTQHHNSALGLLSFRGPSPSYTKAGRKKGNADEAAFPSQSNFRLRQPTFNIGPVDSGSKHTVTDIREEHGTPKTLSLKEALELFRPDFISRSQGRVKRLEQRSRRRRVLQDSNPDLVQGLGEDQGKLKRNCTTPDPLSDNLFKPRERSISGREMQLRSRRIYNKLPEVTRKKEEEKKRVVSQTNRLRAEVFKKRLLDQILQR